MKPDTQSTARQVVDVLTTVGLALSLIAIPACGGAPRASEAAAPTATPEPAQSTPATPSGATTADAGAPATADLCPGIVRDAVEDLTWFVNDFGLLGYVDVQRAPAVIAEQCKTWPIEGQRCVAKPSAVWENKLGCLDDEAIRRWRAAAKPLLDPPTSERVPPPKTGTCDYGTLVEKLQTCAAVPERMRRKLQKQWQLSPGPPRNVCFDAERLLRQRMKEAGCP